MFEQGRRQANLTKAELWWAYFALGGAATPLEFGGYLRGATQPGRLDHNILAHALNERLGDLGLDSPITYFDDSSRGRT